MSLINQLEEILVTGNFYYSIYSRHNEWREDKKTHKRINNFLNEVKNLRKWDLYDYGTGCISCEGVSINNHRCYISFTTRKNRPDMVTEDIVTNYLIKITTYY